MLVADLVLIESLFQTAGAATEKEREANEVEADPDDYYLHYCFQLDNPCDSNQITLSPLICLSIACSMLTIMALNRT